MRPGFARIVLLLSLLPGLAAAGAGLRIDAIDNTDLRVSVQGVWPDACTPQLVTWTSQTQGVDVLIGGTSADCLPGAHRFALELPLGDMFSPALPDDVIRPLRVFAAHEGGTPLLVGFRLLGGHGPSAPGTGFWWPDSDVFGGNALSLEVQGDHLGIALLGHDDHGAPEWYFGTTTLEGSTAHAELTRVTGASPFSIGRSVPRAEPALSVDLAFYSSTRARLWLTRQVADSGEIEVASSNLERRRFDSLPERQTWLGDWLRAGGEGLPATLHFEHSDVDGRGTVRLSGADVGYVLECRGAGADSDAPAQRCLLRDAGGDIQVRFDHVGLDRLDGRDVLGRPVVLLRPRG